MTANAPSFGPREACPLCGAADWRPGRLREPEIRRCNHCQLSYRVDPVHPLGTAQRSADELQQIDAARVPLFEDFLTRLPTPQPGDLLVDVGAGSGYFVEFARTSGWRAVGVEFGHSLAHIARERQRAVVMGDGQNIPVSTATAAVVTLWDVLDQFDRPARAIAEAARVLRPGGTLWVRVRHGGVHEWMRRQAWLPARLSVLHNSLFSPRSLRDALARAGFEAVRVEVSPTSHGDPYAVMRKGPGPSLLRATKTVWDASARLLAALSGGRLVASPSIAVLARMPSQDAERLP